MTLSALALIAGGAKAGPVASLRIEAERSTFLASIDADRASGYRISIDCIDRCVGIAAYREAVGDTPMGLFVRDQNDLVFSLWSSGSAYRVRVWRVTDAGVRTVATLSSRGRPDFLSDRDGNAIIRTYGGESGTGMPSSTRWIYHAGGFVRSRSKGR